MENVCQAIVLINHHLKEIDVLRRCGRFFLVFKVQLFFEHIEQIP